MHLGHPIGLLLACATIARCASIPRRHQKRGITYDPTTLAGNSYDYVIVGGGTAGLVLANRLSANGNTTVAVIEAGGNAFTDSTSIQDRLLAPAMAYFDGLTGSSYDWQFTTVNQANLNNRSIKWPRGKGLGGSSAINGLFLVQPSQDEYNAWATLIGDNNWGWQQSYASRQKAQNYGAEPSYVLQELSADQDTAYWGTNGPISFSFPPPLYSDQEDTWIPTFAAMGVGTGDPGNGHTINAIDSTVAVDPANYTRSYSYTGYLNPILGRSNLQVLGGYTVTNINFEGTTATGVTFAQYDGAQSYSVNATQEVILCGGVVGTPQLLMVSGVGPAATLQQYGINVVNNLPGVGHGLREHLSAEMIFNVQNNVQYSGDSISENPSFAAQQLGEWQNGDAYQSLYSVSNHMIAMLNLSTLFGGSDAAESLIANASQTIAGYAQSLGDSTVQAGYTAVSNMEINTLLPAGMAAIEIIQVNTGTSGGGITMGIQAGLQRPFSRGTILINSASVFSAPTIDPGYLSNSIDTAVLVSGFQYIRALSQTPPLSNLINSEIKPGTSVQSYEDWVNWMQGALGTEYSPLGTCAMLPLSQGGVVDAQMRVYGTQQLRVVDASIIPMNIAAHGCAPTYALAETAAEIILGNLAPSPITSSKTTSSSSTAASAGSKTTSKSSSRTTATVTVILPSFA